jgi:outer membrane protein
LGARYLFNERWGIEGAARWTRLSDTAATSPIVENGTDDQYSVRFDLSRRISLDF